MVLLSLCAAATFCLLVVATIGVKGISDVFRSQVRFVPTDVVPVNEILTRLASFSAFSASLAFCLFVAVAILIVSALDLVRRRSFDLTATAAALSMLGVIVASMSRGAPYYLIAAFVICPFAVRPLFDKLAWLARLPLLAAIVAVVAYDFARFEPAMAAQTKAAAQVAEEVELIRRLPMSEGEVRLWGYNTLAPECWAVSSAMWSETQLGKVEMGRALPLDAAYNQFSGKPYLPVPSAGAPEPQWRYVVTVAQASAPLGLKNKAFQGKYLSVWSR